jgi:hypothetical protein
VTVLRDDIAAFELMRERLEADHDKAWALFHAGQFQAVYDAFEDAADAALDRFGAGPYLIRQIGAPAAVQLPGGMIFTPSHALSPGGL